MKFKDTGYGDLSGRVYNGNINVSLMNLTSLEGAPEIVNGSFYCYKNNLTSLKGAPKEVYGNFNCSHNELKNLEYSPEIVNGDFDCSYNANLKSLEYAPKKPYSFKGLDNIDKSKTPHLFI